MFSKVQFQTLFGYHRHTRSHLLQCAAQLSERDYFEHPGYGHGSIHHIFFHLLRAEYNWRQVILTGRRQAPLVLESFPALVDIEQGMLLEQQAWKEMLDAFSPEQIEGTLRLTDRSGEVSDEPCWRILQHIILHSMQHHAELAQLLTLKGQSPGDIDFIYYEGNG